MDALSFDPVADIYDNTRGYPESAVQPIAQAIDQAANATPQTAFLEVGVGTGRIAFPLVQSGRTYTGVDISPKMLAQFETKLRSAHWQEIPVTTQPWGTLPDEDKASIPQLQRFIQPAIQASVRLVTSNILQLPFYSASFDVVIAVHIFHLIEEWQQALQEVLRVLRPGGLLLQCWDEHVSLETQSINRQWRTILKELGGDVKPRLGQGGSFSGRAVSWLQAQGLQTEQLPGPIWEQTVKPGAVIEHIAQRHWSSSWSIPDDLFAASIERLWQWAYGYYGPKIDEELKVERRFMINRTHV